MKRDYKELKYKYKLSSENFVDNLQMKKYIDDEEDLDDMQSQKEYDEDIGACGPITYNRCNRNETKKKHLILPIGKVIYNGIKD